MAYLSREGTRNLRPLGWFTVGGVTWFAYMLIDWNLLGMGVVASLMVLGLWACGTLMVRERTRVFRPSPVLTATTKENRGPV